MGLNLLKDVPGGGRELLRLDEIFHLFWKRSSKASHWGDGIKVWGCRERRRGGRGGDSGSGCGNRMSGGE